MKKPWWNFLSLKKKKQTKWNFFSWSKALQKESPVKLWEVIVLVLVIYFLIVAWPLRNFISNGFLRGRTLILFTNEAEARPCGGFVTAFGTVEFFPPKIVFKNSYALSEKTFGPASPPLDRISETKNFWDLGTSSDLQICTEEFRTAYEEATTESIDRVLLFDFGTAEQIFNLFGKLPFGGKSIFTKNIFAELSRTVANIDRHDEKELAERKSPLAKLGKSLIWRTIWKPTILPRATRILAKSSQNGQIFSPKISPKIRPERNDFGVIEWNLGGGKSSRFLHKILNLSIRETAPDKWGFFLELEVSHLGDYDEPLSQTWKGVFEIITPKILGTEPVFIEAEIEPGRSFRKVMMFEYTGEFKEFSIFRPRGHNIFANVTISLFPQKSFSKATFSQHENIGYFVGEIKNFRKIFRWVVRPDLSPPFITLHEIIPKKSLDSIELTPESKEKFAPANLFAEVHFNEKTRLTDKLFVTLVDRDFENKDISETQEPITAVLLKDGRTLILGFSQKQKQLNERFYLEIKGIEDWQGNAIIPEKRTLIDRLE